MWRALLPLLITICSAPVFTHAETLTVELTNTGFEPREVLILVGDTITFTNTDTDPHWPASDLHPTHAIYADFDPKRGLEPGESWSFEFTRSGEWRMHDHLVPRFTGTVTVIGTSTETVARPSLLTRVMIYVRSMFGHVYFTLFPTHAREHFDTLVLYDVVRDTKQLDYWMPLLGADEIMRRMITDAETHTYDCHTTAHFIGHSAYRTLTLAVPLRGDHCYAGFFHGIIEMFIAEKGTGNLKEDIDAFCASPDAYFGDFQCYHGAGHGILALENYDLPTALERCQAFDTEFQQTSCYGGVFMENILVGFDEAKAAGHETQWLSDDPHFPCNAIGDDYNQRYQCYQMQTSQMLALSNYDYDTVRHWCATAEPDMRMSCFESFGRDMAGASNRDPQVTALLCDGIENSFWYGACLSGAVNVMVDYLGPERIDEASLLCAVAREEGAQACTETLEWRRASF